MKTNLRLGGALIVLLLVFGPVLMPPVSVQAQGGEEITLVPFTSDTFGIQGLVPEGWTEAAPGAYIRGGSVLDVATLIQQVAAGMSPDELIPILLRQLGIGALPESTGTLETAAYTWTLYVTPVLVAGMDITVDLALAETEAGTALVLLQMLTDEYDALHEAVFLPAVQALAPAAPAATPAAENLPYRAEEVTFSNPAAEGVTLAGTLTLPLTEGPHPAVVLITGSGPQDRDESLATITTLKPFRLIAEHLSQNGIAVLRYDDRGVGGSTGDFSTASGQDLASDASAAVDYLLTRDDINPAQVGILGHSEGGALAPLVAVNNPHVAFVIAMSGTAASGADVLLLQNERILRANGASEEEIATQLAFVQDVIDLTLAGDWDALEARLVEGSLAQLEAAPPEQTAGVDDLEALVQQMVAEQMPMYRYWFPFFFRYDPAEDWARVTVPVLALFGGLDLQVIAEQNIPPLEAAMQAGGNEDYTIVTIPTANHLYQEAVTGSPNEYGTLAAEFQPDFLPTLTDWLLAHVDVAAE